MGTVSLEDYIRIMGYVATASVFLSAVSNNATTLSTPSEYIAIHFEPFSYAPSTLSFSASSVLDDVQKEVPIKGYIKVRIKNTQKMMEWN